MRTSCAYLGNNPTNGVDPWGLIDACLEQLRRVQAKCRQDYDAAHARPDKPFSDKDREIYQQCLKQAQSDYAECMAKVDRAGGSSGKGDAASGKGGARGGVSKPKPPSGPKTTMPNPPVPGKAPVGPKLPNLPDSGKQNPGAMAGIAGALNPATVGELGELVLPRLGLGLGLSGWWVVAALIAIPGAIALAGAICHLFPALCATKICYYKCTDGRSISIPATDDLCPEFVIDQGVPCFRRRRL